MGTLARGVLLGLMWAWLFCGFWLLCVALACVFREMWRFFVVSPLLLGGPPGGARGFWVLPLGGRWGLIFWVGGRLFGACFCGVLGDGFFAPPCCAPYGLNSQILIINRCLLKYIIKKKLNRDRQKRVTKNIEVKKESTAADLAYFSTLVKSAFKTFVHKVFFENWCFVKRNFDIITD